MGAEPARRPRRGVLRGRGGRCRPPRVVVSSRAPPCPHHQRRGHRRGAGGGGRVPRLVGGRYPGAPRSPRGGGRVRRLSEVARLAPAFARRRPYFGSSVAEHGTTSIGGLASRLGLVVVVL